MRGLILGAAIAAALGLSGCAGLGQFIKDSDASTNCFRDIRAKGATVFIFAWPVPIITEASYVKVCNKDKAPAQPSLIQPLAVGSVIPGPDQ